MSRGISQASCVNGAIKLDKTGIKVVQRCYDCTEMIGCKVRSKWVFGPIPMECTLPDARKEGDANETLMINTAPVTIGPAS
jgi:hypothetical protein